MAPSLSSANQEIFSAIAPHIIELLTGADLFSKIAPHIVKLMDTRLSSAISERLRTELVDTNQLFVTRFNDQIAQWQNTTLPVLLGRAMAGSTTLHRPEPPILNLTFSGSHSHLLNFFHVVRDTLSCHTHSFSEDSSRIKWVA